MNNERLKVGDVIEHFKKEIRTNDESYSSYYLYRIVAFATHTETKEKLVIYQALYNSDDGTVKMFDMFARPYDMFMSEVDHEKYPDIKQKYRFEKL